MYYIIVTGNPVEGFRFYGKFDTHGEAIGRAALSFSDETWWIAEVFLELAS